MRAALILYCSRLLLRVTKVARRTCRWAGMDSQPLPDPLSDHILFVTIKGEEALQTQRFMMCVQGNDSIAQVRGKASFGMLQWSSIVL